MPGAGESFAAAHRWACRGANSRSGIWPGANAGAVRPRSKAVPSTALQVLRPARWAILVMECCARRRCGFDPRLTIPPAAARRPLRPPIPDLGLRARVAVPRGPTSKAEAGAKDPPACVKDLRDTTRERFSEVS